MMNQNILVSVIMPCYNVEKYVEIALNSILNQTYTNIEVICIDDCSTDKTLDRLNCYAKKDKRVKVFKNELNLGVTLTRNKAIGLSKGDYIAKFDSDDISHPQRIEKLLYLAIKNDNDLVTSDYSLISEEGDPIKKRGFDTMLTIQAIRYTTFFNAPIQHAPTLFKKQIFEEFSYNSNYLAAEDYHLLSEIILKKNIKIDIIQENLYYYRMNPNGMSFSKRESQIKSHIRIAREFIQKELQIDGDSYDFWEFSKKVYPFHLRTTKQICDSLFQINDIKNKFENKYKLSSIEQEEIDKYTVQYLIFTYFCIIKETIRKGNFLKGIIPVFKNIFINKKIIFRKTTWVWIKKNI